MDETRSGFDPAILREVAAEHAIQRVIGDYGRGVDGRDFERVRRCFHADATITYGSGPTMSIDETIDWLAEVTPALFALSHYFGPAIVDLSTDGRSAACTTWCINTNQYPRGPTGEARQTVSGLRYHDSFALRDGLWRIRTRRNETEWTVSVDENTRLPLPDGVADA